RRKAGWCAGRSRSQPRTRGRRTSSRHTPPLRASGATTRRGHGCTAKAATSITCKAPHALPEPAASASPARASSTLTTCWSPSRVSSATSRSSSRAHRRPPPLLVAATRAMMSCSRDRQRPASTGTSWTACYPRRSCTYSSEVELADIPKQHRFHCIHDFLIISTIIEYR
uniref:Uncharacterized protein n=1 Tax=Aegilops tauschii subsp. strangulata TaxID=200361 RepID=A0A453DKT1_AEGTS